LEATQLDALRQGAREIGLQLASDQVAALARHVDLLLKWNKSVNLTAITDPAEVVEKHVIDSLALAPLVPKGTLLDAGTGGGFPGFPVRIARPDLEVVLADSVQKKVAFLKNLLAEMRLPGVRAVAVRLEGEPAEEGLPRVNAAVSRAFAEPAEWLALAQPYVLPGGLAFCMLGPADRIPQSHGELVLERELAYRLPFSRAQRRIGVYRRR
jgi:16S rRNA (guanine527-N7)-methyltransferase